ncbi:SpoIIE family protein phosphatase OS=Streptomyces tendae OX=1932 GN=F3L20_05005 PE=4 SV=1 [Streptomyces tendae]
MYLATCVYAVYDSVTRRCTFANAGHLPPVLVEPGENALMLDVPPGMPLGVGGEPFEEVEVELPEGALLALYTDGLVESRDHPLDEGLQAFVGALTDPSAPLEDVCDHVLNTLDTHHGEDDIALLMARVQGLPADSVGDWTLPREPRSVGRARSTPAPAPRLGHGAAGRHHGAAGQRARHQRPAVRRGGDPTPAAARPHPGLRGLGLRPGPAPQAARPRHRRGRPGPPARRPAERRLGLTPYARGKTVWFELPLPGADTGLTDPAEALLSLF